MLFYINIFLINIIKMDYSKKLLEFFDIEIIMIFIKTIKKYCHNKRKTKYSIEYYLYHIILVLKELSSWKSLKYLLGNNKPNHYKTIQDIHLKWSRFNIYKIVYNILLKKYKLDYLKRSSNLILFIDSSNIYNKNGSVDTGYGMNPKKKESKISVICDKNKNIYSLSLVKANQKTVNQKVVRKTLPHDSKTIKISVDDLQQNKLKYKNLYLVGDKGYALNKTDKDKLLIDKNVILVYPHKKNQKEKTPKKHKVYLNKRYVIENVYSKLKRYNRICIRKDKLDTTYLGFCFLASLLTFKK